MVSIYHTLCRVDCQGEHGEDCDLMLVISVGFVYNESKEVVAMTLVERITEETRTLPVQTQRQVLDFVQFLKAKEEQRFIAEVDALIEENLPALKELAK